MLKDDLSSLLPSFPSLLLFELTSFAFPLPPSSDYESNPDLDTYSQADIDDVNDFGQMSMRERREAEREMEKRDRGATGGEFLLSSPVLFPREELKLILYSPSV